MNIKSISTYMLLISSMFLVVVCGTESQADVSTREPGESATLVAEPSPSIEPDISVDMTTETSVGPISTPTPQVSPTATLVGPISTPTPQILPNDLSFFPDPGIRMDYASLAKARIGEDGLIYLFYGDTSGKKLKNPIASSTDGLRFGEGRTSDGSVMHPYVIQLPDGTWRQYTLTKDYVIESRSSLDGKVFAEDYGIRYSPSIEDRGTLGTYDIFVDANGGVVLLYVGDLKGLNNVRMAYSPPGDNGWTFSYQRGNILGDDSAGGGSRTYVDIKSVSSPDGRRRLFAMKGGQQIFSFISDSTLHYFSLEPDVRVSTGDFTEFQVISLHDPMVILLPDSRYRMYLHLHILDNEKNERTLIVSSTTHAA